MIFDSDKINLIKVLLKDFWENSATDENSCVTMLTVIDKIVTITEEEMK